MKMAKSLEWPCLPISFEIMKIIYFFVILCLSSISLSRIFTKCELVYELKRQGFPDHLMKDLVCLVEVESAFQTNIRSGSNWDGSFDWGLFQINDRYWCNHGPTPGKDCNIRCRELLSENITVAANCAKIIMSQLGLEAWYGWVNHCKERWLPDLNCKSDDQPPKLIFKMRSRPKKRGIS